MLIQQNKQLILFLAYRMIILKWDVCYVTVYTPCQQLHICLCITIILRWGSKNLEQSSIIWRWGVLHSKTINESWKRIEWDFRLYTLNKPTTISLSLNTQHPRASVSFQHWFSVGSNFQRGVIQYGGLGCIPLFSCKFEKIWWDSWVINPVFISR